MESDENRRAEGVLSPMREQNPRVELRGGDRANPSDHGPSGKLGGLKYHEIVTELCDSHAKEPRKYNQSMRQCYLRVGSLLKTCLSLRARFVRKVKSGVGTALELRLL